MRYFMHWIILDPGNVFIQVLEPINIVDVVIGRNETVGLLSWVICFVVSRSLEAACWALRCADRLLAAPR